MISAIAGAETVPVHRSAIRSGPHGFPKGAGIHTVTVIRLRVTPKPYQKPHPPLWATVSTDRSVSMAAELGMKACYWQPPVRRIAERCKVYAQVRSRVEGRRFAFGEGQAIMRGTYVAGSMEEARRDAEAGMVSLFAHNQSMRGMQIFLDPGEEIEAGTKLDWDFLEPRSFLVGSPAQVIERLEEHREVCNPEEILIGYAHDGVDQRKTLRNIERFGTEFMPHFRNADIDRRSGQIVSAGNRAGRVLEPGGRSTRDAR